MNGQLIPKKNLYYFSWSPIILTTQAQIAYIPSPDDNVAITDNYIFLLGDSVSYSKWFAGSTFYSFNWIDVTNIKYAADQPVDFQLFQNYSEVKLLDGKLLYKTHLNICDFVSAKNILKREKPINRVQLDIQN